MNARAPRIGLTPNLMPAADRPVYKGMSLVYAERQMLDAVARAGAIPLLLPLRSRASDVRRAIEAVDGLIVSGGTDVAPRWYGEAPRSPLWAGQPERDECELATVRAARRRGIPVLGICRGHQLLNVACGGSLWQDLVTLREGSRVHRDASVYDDLSHEIVVEARSRVARLLGRSGTITVNSIHHQGIHSLGRGLVAVARAPDGVIEAIELPADRFTVGIQWHPEWMDTTEQRRLFRVFVRECRSDL